MADLDELDFSHLTLTQINTRLTSVQAAIERVLNSQAYSLEGKQNTRAGLDKLLGYEAALLRAKRALEDGDAPFVLVEFGEPQ